MTNRRSFITGVAGLAAATAIPNVFAQAAAATGSTEPTLARVQRTKTLRIGAVRGAAPYYNCLLYTSPSPRDISGSRMPSSA